MPAGSLELVTPPEVDPVTVAEAIAGARLSGDIADADVLRLIKSATRKVQNDTGRQLITATYYLWLDKFPYGREPIHLPLPPTFTVTEIFYTDGSDVDHTLVKNDDFKWGPGGLLWRIVPLAGAVWPVAKFQTINVVRVKFDAGYGDDSDDIPEDLIHAVLLLVGWFYEHPEDAEMPSALLSSYERLIGNYRVLEYA